MINFYSAVVLVEEKPDGADSAQFDDDSAPVGPVAGAIMACLLVVALAAYCYCHRSSSREDSDSQQALTAPQYAQEESILDLDPENEGFLERSKCCIMLRVER